MQQKSEDKLLLSRALDVVNRCAERHTPCLLGFLSPAERTMLERNVPSYGGVHILYWGGYDEAERAMLVCLPDYAEFDAKSVPITVLEITGRELERLSHRDFLGSVLALGIKREKIGDILVTNERCFMFADADIARFICENLEKIGNAGVKVAIANSDEVKVSERKVKEIIGTVANIRLDAVLGIALNLSRGKAAELVTAGAVQVNWAEITQVSYRIDEGDILSVKGFGRFRLAKIGNLSKKGRTHITIEKYL